MLMLRKGVSSRVYLAVGPLTFTLGILASFVGIWGDGTGLSDFARGVLIGLAAVLLGVSIVFNIAGIRLRRQEGTRHHGL